MKRRKTDYSFMRFLGGMPRLFLEERAASRSPHNKAARRLKKSRRRVARRSRARNRE